MSSKIRNIVILTSVLFLLVPFVLMTDLFPMLRFGMFAEPIRYSSQREYFMVYERNNSAQAWKPFDSEAIGLHPNAFTYLLRNYYYRSESAQLLNIIDQSDTRKGIEYAFARWQYSEKKADPGDSTLICTLLQP